MTNPKPRGRPVSRCLGNVMRSSLAIEALLCARPGCRLVQYSYLPREPFALQLPGLRWRRLCAVWGNAPPAWVWELRSAAG